MNQKPFYKNHLTALDGIRGVSVLCVILAHHVRFPLAFLAMDCFFVLSGFLITGILLDTKGSKGYFKNFYFRRALRIFPIYYFTLFVFFYVLDGCCSLSDNPDFEFYFENEISFWVYFQNYSLAHMDPRQSHALVHLWSLAVEEQFYVFVPLMVFLFSRKNLAFLFGLIIIGALFYRVDNFVNNGSWVIEYMSTVSRMDALALGGVVALLVRSQWWETIKNYRRQFKIVLACLIFYFLLWMLTSDNFYFLPARGIIQRTVNYTLSALMFSLLLVLAVLKDKYITKVFCAKLLTYLGKRSYAIYIFHMPIKHMLIPFLTTHVFWLANLGKWPTICLSLLLATTSGEISWRLIEKQALGLKKYFKYKSGEKEDFVSSNKI